MDLEALKEKWHKYMVDDPLGVDFYRFREAHRDLCTLIAELEAAKKQIQELQTELQIADIQERRRRMHNTRYWMCIIGPVDEKDLPEGANSPMRTAVEKAFEKMLERDNTACWSGWGLTQKRMEEIQKVWNREGDGPNAE